MFPLVFSPLCFVKGVSYQSVSLFILGHLIYVFVYRLIGTSAVRPHFYHVFFFWIGLTFTPKAESDLNEKESLQVQNYERSGG